MSRPINLKHTAKILREAYDCTADATVFHFIEDALMYCETLRALYEEACKSEDTSARNVRGFIETRHPELKSQ